MSQHLNPALPVWDADAATQSLGGDLELARSLLRDLCHQLETDLQRLLKLHGNQDLQALIEEAHRIRGGTAYLGTLALNEALMALAALSPSRDQARIDQALAAVEAEIRRLWQFLETQ